MENDFWESKSIYMKKASEKERLGYHATGYTGDDGTWHNMEAWVNVYDENMKFRYSAARIFGPIEEEVEAMKKDGWEVFEHAESNERT